MENKHAILSASGASRWLTCTPSARLEMQFPDSAGIAAQEGTLAHFIGELLIKIELAGPDSDDLLMLQDAKTSPLYSNEMLAYCEDYAAFVIERFNASLAHTRDAILEQEVKLDMSKYIPEGFGTGDNVIIADGTLEIIDLKYGKGVRVEAEDNEQMMLYALGALEKYDWLYEINTVKMTIYQPRIDNYSTWHVPVSHLKAWAKDILIPAAAKAFDGKGDFVPGEHCMFCRAKAVCKANMAYQLDIARADLLDPVLMDENDIAHVLERQKGFLSWIKAVNEYALREAINNGKRWPGYKLVEGRSNRIYSDEEKVVSAIISGAGKNAADLYTQKILGITAMQGLLTKKVFDTLVGPLIIKPMGKPTLAKETDKRPELSSEEAAKADFAEELENEDL